MHSHRLTIQSGLPASSPSTEIPPLRSPLRCFLLSSLSVLLPVIFLTAVRPRLAAQAIPSADAPPTQQAPPPPPDEPNQDQTQQPPPPPLPPGPPWDKSIFQNPVPAPALAFLSQYDGAPASALWRDRRFRHLVGANIPNCEFHYGRDMPLFDALDMLISHSPVPVRIRANRFVLIAGQRGPYLAGRGFVWIDMQDGLVLGGFYFHPTNGEPTPTLAAFSRQIKTKDNAIAISQLPPDFVLDLASWSQDSGIGPLTTLYFLTGNNRRILLEHTEDYCSPAVDPSLPPPDQCEQENADAADLDMNAAYYLEQVHYATNATAWMIEGQDQIDWLVVRDRTCRVGPDPLACRIRMTRQRTRVIITRPLRP